MHQWRRETHGSRIRFRMCCGATGPELAVLFRSLCSQPRCSKPPPPDPMRSSPVQSRSRRQDGPGGSPHLRHSPISVHIRGLAASSRGCLLPCKIRGPTGEEEHAPRLSYGPANQQPRRVRKRERDSKRRSPRDNCFQEHVRAQAVSTCRGACSDRRCRARTIMISSPGFPPQDAGGWGGHSPDYFLCRSTTPRAVREHDVCGEQGLLGSEIDIVDTSRMARATSSS